MGSRPRARRSLGDDPRARLVRSTIRSPSDETSRGLGVYNPHSPRPEPASPLHLDFSKHIQKAEEAHRRRNYDFAIELYRQLIELNPNLGEARAGLRRSLLERHRGGKKKVGMLGKLKGAGPLAAAKGLMKAGKYEGAAKALETFLGTDPAHEEGNALLGESLRAAGHADAALAVFEFLAEVAPKRADGWREAASIRAEQGDIAGALTALEKALEADPRDREAQKARKDLAAEVALEARKSGEGAHSRQQMADEEGALAQERRRRLHRSAEDWQEELTRLESRYAEDSSNVDLMVEMGEVLEKLRDPEAAHDMYRRAHSYRKDSPELAARVSRMAIKAKKKAIARADRSGDQELADRLEAELGALEQARLEAAVEANPQAISDRLELGKLLLRGEDLDTAIQHLQRVAPDPRLGDEARFFLALCFYRKGLLDLAQDSFQTCLPSSGPVDGRTCEILYHLGLIAEQNGDAQAARAHFSRIYAVDIAYRDVAQKMEQL